MWGIFPNILNTLEVAKIFSIFSFRKCQFACATFLSPWNQVLIVQNRNFQFNFSTRVTSFNYILFITFRCGNIKSGQVVFKNFRTFCVSRLSLNFATITSVVLTSLNDLLITAFILILKIKNINIFRSNVQLIDFINADTAMQDRFLEKWFLKIEIWIYKTRDRQYLRLRQKLIEGSQSFSFNVTKIINHFFFLKEVIRRSEVS